MRHLKTIVTAAAALALIVPAAMAGDHGKNEAEKDMTTIEGEIQKVYTRSVEGSEVVLIDIETTEHPAYTVCLGRKQEDRERPLSLESGDQIAVTGSEMKRKNGENVFIAYELRRGERRWKLDHHEDMHRKM